MPSDNAAFFLVHFYADEPSSIPSHKSLQKHFFSPCLHYLLPSTSEVNFKHFVKRSSSVCVAQRFGSASVNKHRPRRGALHGRVARISRGSRAAQGPWSTGAPFRTVSRRSTKIFSRDLTTLKLQNGRADSGGEGVANSQTTKRKIYPSKFSTQAPSLLVKISHGGVAPHFAPPPSGISSGLTISALLRR